MNFTSAEFLFFFLVFLFLRWAVYPIVIEIFNKLFSPKDNFRAKDQSKCNLFSAEKDSLVFLLLAGSYFFYASWNYKFLGLLLFTSILDFSIGKKIHATEALRARRFLLFISVFLNLSILGFYKYFFFIFENFSLASSVLGITFSRPTWNILLPAGISFYTFQSLSYTIDVYRRILPAEKSFLRYALYLAFFPQLVAGPIVVAFEFLPQIHDAYKRKFREINLNQAFYFILLGFIKKSVLADNISVVSDYVFSSKGQIETLSWTFVLMGMISYSIQIYGDFSGYTDIARGVALLFGFHLPENFNLPYLASSLTDFWRRWHISLSTWLRSYLYIPLGGNRFGEIFTYRNLFLTMLLGGLWHGASWNFVIWGGLHGLYLGFERYIITRFKNNSHISDVRPFVKKASKALYIIFTFCLVTCFWVFFRSANIDIAVAIFRSILNLQIGISPNYTMELQFYTISFTVILAHLFGYFYPNKIHKLFETEGSFWQFPVYAFLSILAVLYSGELKPFIYFVF
jgi:alginate O-acetyltransferase complex protein AlgI